MIICAVEVFNLSSRGQMLGSVVPKGSLGIIVDDYWFDDYQWVTADDIDLNHKAFEGVAKYEMDKLRRGQLKALFAKSGGLLHIYGYVEGSSDGFANRTIRVRVKEPSVMFPRIQSARVLSFTGCLWDSYLADLMVAAYLDTNVYSIGVQRLRNRSNTYTAMKATASLIDHVGKVVVLGEPIQGDFNAGDWNE